MDNVEQAIKQATKARPYNALITETFELARQQRDEQLKKKIKPFTLVVKDNFAYVDALLLNL